MLLRFVFLLAVASIPLTANQQNHVPSCCEPESERLSQKQVKALLEKAEPIQAPCCADMLHISGTVVVLISVDPKGSVICVQMVSGHLLIIGVTIDSVRKWKFQPYISKGVSKTFCGRIALRFNASEHAVNYRIV
jgi:outer membrane biosynthesis protein TonB